MTGAEKVIAIAREEVGYVEKASEKHLDDKSLNTGNSNYTKYARDMYPSLQGQPWCDMFVDWCFAKAFGKPVAQKLLCGGFSAYTPTSAGYYKKAMRWHGVPKPGAQIFFKNSTRIYHTGIVTTVSNDRVYTIEGNTSNGPQVISNGGAVCEKSYSLSHGSIAGYGWPDWSLVDNPHYAPGWHQDANGWWYADSESTYLTDGWHVINGHKYYFNKDGYALTDWHKIGGKWYYFEPRAGHPLECALYVTDSSGAQAPGEFKEV